MEHSSLYFNKKIAFVMYWLAIVGGIILGRLVYLQINLTHYFMACGKKNFLRIESTRSLRGNIRDINGILLATNRPVTTVYWQGTGNRSLTTEQEQTLKQVHVLLGQSLDSQIVTTIASAERLYKQSLIAPDISFEQLSKLEEHVPNHPNLSIITHVERFYPNHTCASHILGYLAGHFAFERYGKMGLEQLQEDILKGKEGTVLKTINSVGRNIAQVTLDEAAAGVDIQTTIDLPLQEICEHVFPEECAGTIILMSTQTGGLQAVLSRPNFNPNIFLRPIPIETWYALQENRPFLNRAFSGCYPPGSIFKLITISAALEHNIVSPHATVHCYGHIQFAGRSYGCSQKHGHGELTVMQAVAESCNALFFDIGRHIDIDLLAQYAYKFGLGQKTNIIFAEKNGIVPSRHWKMYTRSESWWPGETLSASIGQSFLLVTPIQVARMIASIFTGYLVTPRILVNEPITKIPLDIQPTTRQFLKKAMKLAATDGTARRIGRVKDIDVYAKTSTAQTSALEKRTLGTSYLEHGWVVCYFQYKNQSPMVIVILVENAGTSQIPTTIAKKFLIEYKRHIDTFNISTQGTEC